MTSNIGGTNSAYLSIAPYRLYLELTEADKEFMTDYYNPLKYVPKTEYQFNDKQTTYTGTISRQKFIPTFSAYDKITEPCFSRIKSLIDKYKLSFLLNGDKTFFFPTDDSYIWPLIYEKLERGIISVESFIRFHIVNTIITPVQLLDHINRVDSMLTNETFLIDGKTNNRIRLMMENNYFTKYDNFVIETTKTDNGWVYKIVHPMYPYTF